MANNAPLYIGFNTINSVAPPYNLYDIELVKQDLLNAFNTRKGERVMLPNFGTNIYDYLFDPLDDLTKDAIIEDATNVIKHEPRVSLDTINLTETELTIRLEIILTFKPGNSSDLLIIDFQKQNEETF